MDSTLAPCNLSVLMLAFHTYSAQCSPFLLHPAAAVDLSSFPLCFFSVISSISLRFYLGKQFLPVYQPQHREGPFTCLCFSYCRLVIEMPVHREWVVLFFKTGMDGDVLFLRVIQKACAFQGRGDSWTITGRICGYEPACLTASFSVCFCREERFVVFCGFCCFHCILVCFHYCH